MQGWRLQAKSKLLEIGKTQKEAAEEIGCSESVLSQVLHGRRGASDSIRLFFAKLGVLPFDGELSKVLRLRSAPEPSGEEREAA